MMTSAIPARDAKMAGTIHLKPPAVGGAIGADMVTQAVQIELDKQDNQAKLATAASGERSELFVWLVDNEASMALTTPLISGGTVGMPVDAPVLPEMVTSVWAATGIYDTGWHARAVWRSDGGVWTSTRHPFAPVAARPPLALDPRLRGDRAGRSRRDQTPRAPVAASNRRRRTDLTYGRCPIRWVVHRTAEASERRERGGGRGFEHSLITSGADLAASHPAPETRPSSGFCAA